jgi:hypothetical protein
MFQWLGRLFLTIRQVPEARGAGGRNTIQAPRNKNKGERNKIQAERNENKIGRNEIKTEYLIPSIG